MSSTKIIAQHFCFTLAFWVFNSLFVQQGPAEDRIDTSFVGVGVGVGLFWFGFFFSEKHHSHAGEKMCIPDIHMLLYKNLVVNMIR